MGGSGWRRREREGEKERFRFYELFFRWLSMRGLGVIL